MFSILVLAAAMTTAAAEAPVKQMFVFGDSYSDTGNGYVDGNGPTAVAYFATKLGLRLLPANDPLAVGAKVSLNFAVSGAGTGRGNGRKVMDGPGKEVRLGIGMENQVDDFAERVKSGTVKFDPKRTLFYLAGGLNDRRLESAETVRNLEARIRTLAGLGARRFAVALLPVSIPPFRDVSVRLNPELAKIPAEVRKEIQGIEIHSSDWGPFFDRVMADPARYGIQNTKDQCAGRGIRNEDTTPCKLPDAHYYYHEGHPSTAVHRAVGTMLFEEHRRRR